MPEEKTIEQDELNAGVTLVDETNTAPTPEWLRQDKLAHEIWEATGCIEESPFTLNNWLIAGAILEAYTLTEK